MTADLARVDELNDGGNIIYQKGDSSKVTYEWSFVDPKANNYFSISANGDKATIKALPQSSQLNGYHSSELLVVGYIDGQPAGEDLYHITSSMDFYEITTSDGKSLSGELNKLYFKETYTFKPALMHYHYEQGTGAKKEKSR